MWSLIFQKFRTAFIYCSCATHFIFKSSHSFFLNSLLKVNILHFNCCLRLILIINSKDIPLWRFAYLLNSLTIVVNLIRYFRVRLKWIISYKNCIIISFSSNFGLFSFEFFVRLSEIILIRLLTIFFLWIMHRHDHIDIWGIFFIFTGHDILFCDIDIHIIHVFRGILFLKLIFEIGVFLFAHDEPESYQNIENYDDHKIHWKHEKGAQFLRFTKANSCSDYWKYR